jgi:hypothetical protein
LYQSRSDELESCPVMAVADVNAFAVALVLLDSVS